ncbi:hypothetical protein EmuJ_000357300 [Echinococcus multilocularis]|uniref:Uncharacterized protein n=1 Tax=Echinococcus multilocularis TaxID=6211 RepID=A0A068Y251_ECHMU|nr:hypothetical protein EmuJ_000357300 [Echinococcus multilocularis]
MRSAYKAAEGGGGRGGRTMDASRNRIDAQRTHYVAKVTTLQLFSKATPRSHTTQLVHKAPHLPTTRDQRVPVSACCQSREFQVVFGSTIDVAGTSQL